LVRNRLSITILSKKGQFLIRKDGGAVYFDQDDETRVLLADVGGGDKSRYTIQKFTDNETGEVTEMPENPDHTHEWLVAQGWNWSLQDASKSLCY
jgi:hypothetical protein